MRSRLALAGLACALVAACGPPVTPEEAVRNAFANYQDGLLTGFGARSANWMSTPTIAFYEDVRDLSLHAPRAEVEALPLSTRMLVLSLRHMKTSYALQRIKIAELVEFSIVQGWLDPQETSRLSLGEVIVAGDQATAEVLRDGTPTGDRYEFSLEATGWRVHLMEELGRGADELLEMIRERGLDENDFVLELIGMESNEAVPESVWDPVVGG